MKRKVKSYLVFTPQFYRLLMFFLIPLGLLALQILLPIKEFVLVPYVTVLLLVFAEVVLDFWVFGGIAVKDGRQLDYLKTSKRGMNFIKDVLSVNMIRQFLESALLLVFGGGIFWLKNKESFFGEGRLLYCLAALVLGYFFTVTELTIARFFDGLMINVGIAVVGAWLMGIAIYLISLNCKVMAGVLLSGAIAVSVVDIKVIMKRLEESYYDQTD